MRRAGYLQSNGDHTLFYKYSRIGRISVLMVYIDDIIITGSEGRVKLGEGLMHEFAIKNLGPVIIFLGIEVAHSPKGILLS